jgi:hypothetical protein
MTKYACCKRMFRVFHVFQTYASSISSECSISTSGCCITCMMQAFVLSVSYVCCKCFIWMLHMFCNRYTRDFHVFQMFSQVFSYVRYNCFSCFRTYVANLDVAHVAVWPTYHNLLLQLLGRRACVRGAEGWSTGRRRVRGV